MFYYLNFTIYKPVIQFRNKDYSTNCDTIHGIKITGLIIFFKLYNYVTLKTFGESLL